MIQRYNSTIGIKLKPCKSCGVKSPIFSKGRCKQCATVESVNKRFSSPDSEELVDDLSGLEDDLDRVVSRIVRIGEADSNGNVSCFTCGATNHFTKMQCGHFIPRANKALRWELTNLRTQCVSCNEHKDGNSKVFAERLDKENPGTSEWLKEQGRQPVKYYRHELKQILLGYRAKLKIIEQKLKK